MDVLVEVSNEFGLSAHQIAFAWNSQGSHTMVAVARPRTRDVDDFDGTSFADSVSVVLGSLASGLTVNAIYDLLKSLLIKERHEQEIIYTVVDKPDGTKIIQVRLSEKK